MRDDLLAWRRSCVLSGPKRCPWCENGHAIDPATHDPKECEQAARQQLRWHREQVERIERVIRERGGDA